MSPGTASRNAPLQLIIFRLADEDFAIPIGEVREIIRAALITPVPGQPGFIRGMINVRGEIAVVIDLKRRFGIGEGEEEPKHVVITAQGKNIFAFLVDEVTEILRLSPDELKPAPEAAARTAEEYVKGFVIREGRLIALLDIAKALPEEAPAGAVP